MLRTDTAEISSAVNVPQIAVVCKGYNCPSGGVASGLVTGILKKFANVLTGRLNEKPSLQKSYENLKQQLRASGRRFVVTIDDIDRLEDSEIALIMQMVKSIGQLPNVTYLLAYDRKIVWSALRKAGEVTGPHFAEKIVQQEIELPKPTRNSLLEMLDKEIYFLTGETMTLRGGNTSCEMASDVGLNFQEMSFDCPTQ